MPVILGIESSCDDTAAAILEDGSIRSNVIANQRVHEHYGGVVPELAARAHLQNIVPVVDQALAKAAPKPSRQSPHPPAPTISSASYPEVTTRCDASL